MSRIMNGVRPIEILLVEDSISEAELTMEALGDGRVRNRIHWIEDGEDAIAFLGRQGRHAARAASRSDPAGLAFAPHEWARSAHGHQADIRTGNAFPSSS